jgi:hypothetical protein
MVNDGARQPKPALGLPHVFEAGAAEMFIRFRAASQDRKAIAVKAAFDLHQKNQSSNPGNGKTHFINGSAMLFVKYVQMKSG